MTEIPNHEVNIPRDLSEQRIALPQGQRIARESDIEQFVEGPARGACIDLFQKNVLTLSSSAHDGEAIPYIDIDSESLSETNKVVLDDLIERGQAEMIEIENQTTVAKIKANNLNDHRTTEEISNALLKITANFTTQPLTRGFYDLDELKRLYGYSPDEYDDVSIEDFVAQGFVLDEETGKLFESKELIDQYRKGARQQ